MAAAAIPLPAAGPAGTQALPPGGAPGPRRLSRTALIGGAGVAAVVIAAVAVGTTLLIVRGPAGGSGTGGHHGSGTSGSHRTGTSAAQGTGSSAEQAGGTSAPATPQPTLPPDLDRCMIGVWKGVNESVTNQINGQPVPFVGPGATTQTFRPNGRAKADYGKSTVYRATVNGSKWTYVFHGYVTYHWRTKHGRLYGSHDRGHGSWQLLDNGVVNNSGPLTHLAPGPARYTCSGKSLQTFNNTGSVTLAREQPKPQPGS
jgi:hypothetical protein